MPESKGAAATAKAGRVTEIGREDMTVEHAVAKRRLS